MLLVIHDSPKTMRSCIDHLIALPHIAGPRIREEAEFIASRLEILRVHGEISNDAFLDAGAIQGAFTLIGNLVEMGIPQQEIQQELRNTLARAKRLEEKHPGLDVAIENGRAS
ncbi:MAG: hypothetical protein DWC00_03990 [Candidatus Poseidoniales archaeon]|nr:MAG: hypothetical protein DWC00_03990 [Candidatus Poseidoniales archaeon]